MSELNNDSKYQTEDDLNQSQAKQDTKIEEIQKKDNNQDEKLEFLQRQNQALRDTLLNISPTVQGKGENVTLTGTAKALFAKLLVGGNSIQDGEPSQEAPVEIKNIKGNMNISVYNKNFVDINKFESKYITKRTESSITQNFTAIFQNGGSVKIPLLNKKYLASISIPNGGSARVELRFFKDDTIISNDTKTFATTFKIDNTSGKYDYMEYRLSNGNKIGEITFENPQVEIIENDSNSPSEYILHKEQIKNFPLEEGQVFHLDDYLADDGIHQTEKQYALTGNEAYQYFGVDENGNAKAWIFSVIDSNMDYAKPVLCNMLKFSSSENFIKNSFYFNPKNKGICIKLDDTIKTVDEFKAFIKQKHDEGNPFIIQYKLIKEEIIPYTPAQQKAYDEIMELTSYEDITHIVSEDEVSPIFDVTAYAKGTNTVQEQTNAVQSEPNLEPPSYDNQIETPSYEEDTEEGGGIDGTDNL